MISESASAILAKRNAQAEANRRSMPTVTAWLDEVRQTFPDARIRFAQEAGHTVGTALGSRGVSADKMALDQRAAPARTHEPVSKALRTKYLENSQEHLFA